MPKYIVTIEETAVYTVELNAKNNDAACEKAEELFLTSIKIDPPFCCEVPDRVVVARTIRRKKGGKT